MKRQEAFFILIATFILVLAWITFSILDSAISSTISQSLNAQIIAIQPSFNTKIINDLKTRQQIVPLNVDPVIEASTSVKPVSFTIEDSLLKKQGTSSGYLDQEVPTIPITPTTETVAPTLTP